MKRRVLAGFLAVKLVFGLCGCAKKTAEKEASPKEVQEQATEETEAATEEETDTAEESALLTVLTCGKSYYEYDEEIEQELFSGITEGVVLAEECKDAYPKLYDALQKNWEKVLADSDKYAMEQKKEARTLYEEVVANGGEPGYMNHFVCENKVYVHRADEKVLSYSTNNYTFLGGVHGMYGDFGDTFDAQTGEKLKLSDVITDPKAYGQILFDKVSENYPDVVDYLEDPNTLRDQIVEEVSSPDAYNWELDPDGIVYFFNPYDIAAYAAGQQIIKVGYKEQPELFNEAYLPPEGRDYVCDAPAGNNFMLDADGDGKYEIVSVYPHYVEDSGDYSTYAGFDVGIGEGQTITIAEDFYLYEATGCYAQFANGKTYLLVDCQTDNDYHEVIVCEVGNGDVREVGRYGVTPRYNSYEEDSDIYYAYAYTDPAAMQMSEHFDRLSTYYAGGTYRMTDQGKIEPLGDYAYLSEGNRDYFVLTSTAEIQADIVDEEGNVKKAGATFPVGTNFTIYRTSYPSDAWEECQVDCLLEDGTIVRFNYTMDSDGNRLVNGQNEWDIFDNLLYAG